MSRAFAALLLLIAAATAPPTPPVGFKPDRAKWQLDYERRLLALPRPEECDALLRELTRAPHLAGTDGGRRVAEFVAAEFRKAGLKVETPTYDVLLSYPKSASLTIVGEPEVRLARSEEAIASDADSAIGPTSLPWNAYAPSADVSAEVVYVNHGAAEDYDRLARMGVDVRGKIALARYFGGYRGGKSLEGKSAASRRSSSTRTRARTAGSRARSIRRVRGDRRPTSSAAPTSTTSSSPAIR